MEILNPPRQLIKEPSNPDAMREMATQAFRDGCRMYGGYVRPTQNMHPLFRSEGKKPNNDYSDIGNREHDAIVITHTDLDGLAAASMYEYLYDEVKILHADHGDEDGLSVVERVANRNPDCPVYIADIQPSDAPAWNRQLSRLDEAHIRDHHPAVQGVTEADYVHAEDKCSAEIVLLTDVQNPPNHLQTLAEAAGVRDLWRHEHRGFQRYALIEIAADICIRSEIIELFAEHGTGILDDCELYDALRRVNYERWMRTDVGLSLTELHDEREVGDITIRTIHGHADTNILAHHARNEFDADLIANVYPMPETDGGDTYIVPLRASPSAPIAGDIATLLNGGGHPQAAGASLTLKSTAPTARAVEAGAVIQQLARLVLEEG